MWNPFKMLRTKDWQKLKSSRLFIFNLVIQDHIESIGKSILLKGDEVLLNGLLAQMLSDIAPKPSTTFSIQICPKPNSNSASPILSIRCHRVHMTQPQPETLTAWSHRDGLANAL